MSLLKNRLNGDAIFEKSVERDWECHFWKIREMGMKIGNL